MRKLRIVYHDSGVCVLYKPAGMATQPPPSGGMGDDLIALARQELAQILGKAGAPFLMPVHRLDRPVSGLVLCARSSKSLQRLQEQMRRQEIQRSYLALVDSPWERKDGRLVHYLIHGSHKAHVRLAASAEAKEAVLHYRLLGANRRFSLLELQLETGRYHQIRAQLAYEGHPILGDDKYGSRHAFAPGAIALHGYALSCRHPKTGAQLSFREPPPEQFLTAMPFHYETL